MRRCQLTTIENLNPQHTWSVRWKPKFQASQPSSNHPPACTSVATAAHTLTANVDQ
jgi:hypothetical protein